MLSISSVVRLPALGAALLLLGAAPQGAFSQASRDSDITVTFGITPFLDVKGMEKEFSPIIEYVGKRAGVKMRFVLPLDYYMVAEDMIDGHIDLAWFAPNAYVMAKEKIADLKIIAQLSENGRTYYEGYIIVRSDSGIGSLADLRGGSFGFVNERSASGYIYPRAMMFEKGIDPVTFFGKILFLGDHTSVVKAVSRGKVDAGATYDAAFAAARDRGMDSSGLSIIARTASIPQDVICARSGIDEKALRAISEAFFNINRGHGPRIAVKGYGAISFVPGNDADFDAVRRARTVKQGG